MTTLFIIGILVLAILMNVPIAFAMALSGIVLLLITDIAPSSSFIEFSFSALNSFPLLAVPFFVLAGQLMSTGGIAKRIVDFSKTIVGSLTGGLGYIAIVASLIFSAMSGSGVATAAAVGGIMLPLMKDMGYKPGYSTTVVASAGSLGAIIPPSITLILYGVMANVSIGGLFIAGLIPGFVMGMALFSLNYFISKKEGYFGSERSSLKEVFRSFNKAKFALFTPVIILGGIYSGIFTPTESAVVAVIYCLIVSLFIYKELTFRELPIIIMRASITTGSVLIVVGSSIFFGRLLALQQVPQMLSDFIQGVSTNPIVILIIINILLLIVGMFVDGVAALLIFVPLLLPIITDVGIDPMHFGIIVTLNLCIGMFTPPIGLNLFVAAKTANIPVDHTYKYVLIFLLTLIVVLMLITYIPELSLFLPRLLN